MNRIKKITLVQFKNYNAASFEFQSPVTCITGPNGSGKTNLLDAIYYLCYTKSYFSSFQQHAVKHGMDGFRVEGIFGPGEAEGEVISCKWKAGKKEVQANGVDYEKVNDHIGKYAAVMIAPDDMELINDGSEGRRRWIDGILGQTDRDYLEALIRYQKVLQQRNAWLKIHADGRSFDDTQLEYYNNQLTDTGTYIYDCRRSFIQGFSPLLQQYYEQLAPGRETIGISYDSDLHQQSMLIWLHRGLQHDLRLQRTLRGIHKDDLDFTFNGSLLKQFGSQGQKKSYLFALKLAQFSYLAERQGRPPLLLLDDIFEKLDQQRMEALLRIIRGPGFGQVVLTDTHAERVREAFGDTTALGFIQLGGG